AAPVRPATGRVPGSHGATATAGRAEQARPLVDIELRRQCVGAEAQLPGQAREPGPRDRARQRARHGRARALERSRAELRVAPPRRERWRRRCAPLRDPGPPGGEPGPRPTRTPASPRGLGRTPAAGTRAPVPTSTPGSQHALSRVPVLPALALPPPPAGRTWPR